MPVAWSGKFNNFLVIGRPSKLIFNVDSLCLVLSELFIFSWMKLWAASLLLKLTLQPEILFLLNKYIYRSRVLYLDHLLLCGSLFSCRKNINSSKSNTQQMHDIAFLLSCIPRCLQFVSCFSEYIDTGILEWFLNLSRSKCIEMQDRGGFQAHYKWMKDLRECELLHDK